MDKHVPLCVRKRGFESCWELFPDKGTFEFNFRRSLKIQQRLFGKENCFDFLKKKLVEKKKGKNEQLNLQCLQTALGSSGKGCAQANCCSSFIIPKRSSLVSIFSYRIFTASKLVQKGDNWDLHIWHTCQGFRLNKVMYSA